MKVVHFLVDGGMPASSILDMGVRRCTRTHPEGSVKMHHTRAAVASMILAVTVSIGFGPARAIASDADPSVPLSAISDLDSRTDAEIYAAKTAISHDQIMRKLGASDAVSTTRGSVVAPAAACTFASDGDYVHVSTYDGIRYASGHGYWWNLTCPSGYRADVTIWLEEKLNGTWYFQGSAVTGKNRAPGSGSTQRVNNKVKCVNSSSHQWRSIILADIVGHADSAPLAYTVDRTLSCY